MAFLQIRPFILGFFSLSFCRASLSLSPSLSFSLSFSLPFPFLFSVLFSVLLSLSRSLLRSFAVPFLVLLFFLRLSSFSLFPCFSSRVFCLSVSCFSFCSLSFCLFLFWFLLFLRLAFLMCSHLCFFLYCHFRGSRFGCVITIIDCLVPCIRFVLYYVVVLRCRFLLNDIVAVLRLRVFICMTVVNVSSARLF